MHYSRFMHTIAILAVCSLIPVYAAHTEQSLSSQRPNELSTAEWQGLQKQIQMGRYRAYPGENGSYNSSNPAHGWRIEYSADGTTQVTPYRGNPDSYQIGLRLNSIGYAQPAPMHHPDALTADNNRLTFQWNDNISEFWINSTSGLEQWFQIAQRLPGHHMGIPLTITMHLDTDLSVAQHGDSIRLNRGNHTRITYDKLNVWDATGQTIAAQMQLQGKQLNLIIEDQQAVYPLTIDPVFSQEAYIKASNAEEEDMFGMSVALDGDTLVVGAPEEDSDATGIDGDQSNNLGSDSGAVYVFTRTDDTWTQQAYIKASNAEIGDLFGYSVDISGDTLAVGALIEDGGSTGVNGNENSNTSFRSGAAYVFTRSGTTWTQQAYVKASNTDSNDFFGTAVAIDGDTLAVSAIFEDSNASGVNGNQGNDGIDNTGAVYVYTRTGTTWSQQAYIKASNPDMNDEFGEALALDGDTLAVSTVVEASNADGIDGDQTNNSANRAGAVYVFTRSGTTWSQQAYVKASNSGGSDAFGFSLDVSGDTMAVGATGEDSNGTGVGAVQNNNMASASGAVYVFTRSGTTWSQQEYIKSSNSESSDLFGGSVALDGDTLAVGATGEDSNATGVDGDQTDNSFGGAGAVYAFSRSGSTWTQERYIKASNTEGSDFFGLEVALSGDTLAVATAFENSNATGINGNQADNTAPEAGAVYVFAPPPLDPTIGGNVLGLAAGNSVTLQNNGGDDLVVMANGSFTFDTTLMDGENYLVTVSVQPTTPDQVCTVSNGSGTVSGSNVTNVLVECVTVTHTVGGMVSGLQPGNTVTLQNNGGDDLVVMADGPFTFATGVDQLADYLVTVSIQPTSPNQTCTVSNGSGTIGMADVTDVMVDCVLNTHTIGGMVSGLATGNSVVLQNNGGDDISVPGNGPFTFPTALLDGADFAVTVLTQPTTPSQTCTVSNGSGMLSGSDVTNVMIDCVTDRFSIGGNVAGLTPGLSVVLRNNGGNDTPVNADGSFTFSNTLVDESSYDVTVRVQPPGQICSVSNGMGVLAGSDVTDVAVECNTEPSPSPDFYGIDEDNELNATDADGTVTGDPNDNGVLANDSDVEDDVLQVANPGPHSVGGIGGSIVINTDGTFDYTPPNDEFGNAVVDFQVTDGIQTVDSQLVINVQSVNDPPSFSLQGDLEVNEFEINSGLFVLDDFAFNISPGPDNESGQQVGDFDVSILSDPDNTISAVSISSTGVLEVTFTANLGVAMIGASLQDDGGTGNGGEDTSPAASFFITHSDEVIFRDSYEQLPVLRVLLVIESAAANAAVSSLAPAYDFDADAVDFLGERFYLDNDYESLQTAERLQAWLNEVLLIKHPAGDYDGDGTANHKDDTAM